MKENTILFCQPPRYVYIVLPLKADALLRRADSFGSFCIGAIPFFTIIPHNVRCVMLSSLQQCITQNESSITKSIILGVAKRIIYVPSVLNRAAASAYDKIFHSQKPSATYFSPKVGKTRGGVDSPRTP